jgi:sensor histidine kinase regulating citrate/malate metabolism
VEEAVDFATEELQLAQALTDQVVAAVSEPVLAALLLGKAAQANERGAELVLTPDSRLDDSLLPPRLPSRDLVTVVGNLIDNALEAAAPAGGDTPTARTGPPPRVTVTVRTESTGSTDGGPDAGTPASLLLRVADNGPGITDEAAEAVFRRGWSTKQAGAAGGRGLGLALVRQAARRLGGEVELGGSAEGGAAFTVRVPLPEPAGRGVPA